MAYYRSCPFCGEALDPGEICECKKMQRNAEYKKTDPEATNNRIGKVEQGSTKLNYSTDILLDREVSCQG